MDEGVAALETADRMLAPLPNLPSESRIALGVAYERQGRLDRAERVYEEVLQAHADQPDALWRLGVVRWGQGRRAEGARLWERAIEVDPRHARAMTDLGIAAAARGDLAGAEALWLRAAKIDPRTAGPWLYLGDVYAAPRGPPTRSRGVDAVPRAREVRRVPREREVVERGCGSSRERRRAERAERRALANVLRQPRAMNYRSQLAGWVACPRSAAPACREGLRTNPGPATVRLLETLESSHRRRSDRVLLRLWRGRAPVRGGLVSPPGPRVRAHRLRHHDGARGVHGRSGARERAARPLGGSPSASTARVRRARSRRRRVLRAHAAHVPRRRCGLRVGAPWPPAVGRRRPRAAVHVLRAGPRPAHGVDGPRSRCSAARSWSTTGSRPRRWPRCTRRTPGVRWPEPR